VSAGFNHTFWITSRYSSPLSDRAVNFVGVSRPRSAAADARDDARENAFIQVMRFYGAFLRSSAVERTSFTGSSGETIAALIRREEEISNFAQAVVSQVGTDRYYTEVYLNSKNQEEYVAYTRCQIPRKKAEQDIADFAKNTSLRYGSLLATSPSLRAALLLYGETLAALEQNPLHRAVAYYDSPNGWVNLYEYLNLQLSALAGSVSFASLPPVSIEKTAALIICDASISFSQNGRTQESASTQVTDLSVPGAVEPVRKFIEENERFFRNITKKITQ
jgi:hypothetical protein